MRILRPPPQARPGEDFWRITMQRELTGKFLLHIGQLCPPRQQNGQKNLNITPSFSRGPSCVRSPCSATESVWDTRAFAVCRR